METKQNKYTFGIDVNTYNARESLRAILKITKFVESTEHGHGTVQSIFTLNDCNEILKESRESGDSTAILYIYNNENSEYENSFFIDTLDSIPDMEEIIHHISYS